MIMLDNDNTDTDVVSKFLLTEIIENTDEKQYLDIQWWLLVNCLESCSSVKKWWFLMCHNTAKM